MLKSRPVWCRLRCCIASADRDLAGWDCESFQVGARFVNGHEVLLIMAIRAFARRGVKGSSAFSDSSIKAS